jgi:hypothetical protein
MARSRKNTRPADPAQIALRRAQERERERLSDREPDQWGIAVEGLALPANAMVSAASDGSGRITRARRQGVFDLLKGRGALSAVAHEAICRLQDDVAILHSSVSGCVDYAPRVDRSRPLETFNERRHRASLRIEAVLGLSGPASARLLGALCEAGAALGPTIDWRMLVRRETGETLPDAQGAILRAACDNLAEAYVIIDRGRNPSVGR